MDSSPNGKLTTEKLLRELAAGLNNSQIAAKYGVSKGTVERDLGLLYWAYELDGLSTAGGARRAAAVAQGFRRGLLT